MHTMDKSHGATSCRGSNFKLESPRDQVRTPTHGYSVGSTAYSWNRYLSRCESGPFKPKTYSLASQLHLTWLEEMGRVEGRRPKFQVPFSTL